MKSLNILAFIFFAISDKPVNVISSHSPYLRKIHYPIDEQFSRHCQLDYSGISGVCKRFEQCASAQNGWFRAKIYPTVCYYHGFEAIVCCVDEVSTSNFPHFNAGEFSAGNNNPNIGQQNQPIGNGQQSPPSSSNNQFPINTGNNQGNFPSQFPSLGNEQQNRPSTNNQFPSSTGNSQGNLPNSNDQFPIFENEQQSRPSTNNQFPSSTGNNQGNFPNQFPSLGNEQQNRPSTNNQFPSSTGNSQGNLPNSNDQFPIFENEQQSRPSTNNQFPSSTGNNQGNFPSQFPSLGNEQQNRPSTNNQFPSSTGNSQGNLPNSNDQFPIFGNEQQSRPSTNNQFPISTGNNQGNFPNLFPSLGNEQQNRPSTNNQLPISTGNNQGNLPNSNDQFPIFGNEQQNRPNSSSGNNQGNFPNQFPSLGNEQQNRPSTNNLFPSSTGNNQGNLPNSNNQFPIFGNEQQSRPSTNNQFPISTGNNQGNLPNSNNQFPIFGNEQQNRPSTNNQFPISTANNQGNFPNTNNQFPTSTEDNKVNQQSTNKNLFPIDATQINDPDLLSDCTVVVLEDDFTRIGTPCVVPNLMRENKQNQNQFGQINTQIESENSSSTILSQQDQPGNTNQVSNEPEEDEYEPPRLSQNKCDDVYDVTPLVGGEPTEIGHYPFMAAIGWKGFDNKLEFSCGGFLVSRRFVLTAAHCATLGGDIPVAVRTGGIDLDNTTNSDLDIPIEEIIVHPNYNDKETYNDIALIRLSKNANDGFACLWQKNEIDKEYEEIKAIGYGHKEFGGPGSNSLLQIKLKLFDNKHCSSHYKPDSKFPNGIIESQICSGDLNRAKDTCQGDSGGPIFIERTSNVGMLTPVVIGITSFGQGCAGEAPSIYTRISSFLDWIEPIVWPDF